MKRTQRRLIWCGLCVALLNFGAQAQETPKARAKNLQLNLVWIVDAEPGQFVWQIDKWPNFAYQSLASENLRKQVAELPEYSIIEYSPSDARIWDGPSYEEIEQFQEFCKTEKIELVIHPAG